MNLSQKRKRKTIESKKAITDMIDKPQTKDNTNDIRNNDIQKALVLQGGGALAAYEVGVYSTLYFWRRKEIERKNGRNDDHIFDVISGTSGGAINGWIVINHVLAKINQGYSVTDSWKGSFKKLLDFWDYTSSSPDFTKWGPYSIALELESIPGFPPYAIWKWTSDKNSWISTWKKKYQETNKSIETGEAKESMATAEAARRYYCSKEYLYSGAENVFSRLPSEHDNRFFDGIFPPSNTWYRYSNKPLRASIEKFSSLKSIATTYRNNSSSGSAQDQEKKEIVGPRLLVVAVDVEKGQDITFDSYEKKDRTRKTEYQQYDEDINKQQSSSPPIPLAYNEGITLDHVMASASVPVNYDYALVPIDSSNPSNGKREFWDGGILSNTPLRELIQAHEDYWNVKRTQGAHGNHGGNNSNKVPNLEVYIANIWPSNWKDVPLDHDAVKDRKNDLTYKDKTLQEEKIAYLIHDYIELASKLMDLAKEMGATETEIDNYLKDHLTLKSKHRDGTIRTHQELIENKVEITKVIRIERHYDPDDISYKWCDYSCDTVSHMIERGMIEALESIIEREKKQDPLHFNISDELDKFINLVDSEKEAEGLTQKQPKILTKPAAELLKDAAKNIIRAHSIVRGFKRK
jgi:predicted acylesterase/phospholipase RssA